MLRSLCYASPVRPDPELVSLARRLFRVLGGTEGVQVALIGALARNLYAAPRATEDIDFAMIVDGKAAYAACADRLAEMGFALRQEKGDPPEQYPSIAVFETEETKLDLLIAKTAFEHQAVRESLLLGDGEDAIAAVRPEDLIVYKLIANRTRDREDIAAVIERLIAREQAIDWRHIEQHASAFGIEQRAEWARELARNVEHGLGR